MLVHTGIILSAMTHWEYDKAFPDLHAANESLREWVQFFSPVGCLQQQCVGAVVTMWQRTMGAQLATQPHTPNSKFWLFAET